MPIGKKREFTNIKNCYEFLLNYDKEFNVSYNALYKAIIDNKKYEYKGYSFNWYNSYRVFTGVEMPIYRPDKNELALVEVYFLLYLRMYLLVEPS